MNVASFLRRRAMKPAAPVTVRETYPFGSCRTLGVLVRATATGLVYRDANGKTKRVSLKPARRGSMPSPKRHTEPCTRCSDHPETVYTAHACMHGRDHTRGEFCETCASM